MPTYTNAAAVPSTITTPPAYSSAPAVLLGDSDVYVFQWISTARPLITDRSAPNVRERTSCFMRGLKETVRLQTNSGLTWKWRRICFTHKGGEFIRSAHEGAYFSYINGRGPARNLSITDSANRTVFDREIFEGTFNMDYRTYMEAKVDTTRVSLKYDRIMTIQSGNERGVWRHYKMWHPMNKNLVYDDDEAGDNITGSQVSVNSKLGMGDYYVVDLFQPSVTGTNAERMSVDINSVLYWHEK